MEAKPVDAGSTQPVAAVADHRATQIGHVQANLGATPGVDFEAYQAVVETVIAAALKAFPSQAAGLICFAERA